jgi:hypothetical protein
MCGTALNRVVAITGLDREVDKNCALLGYYADSAVNPYRRFGTNYRSHLQGSLRFLTPENGANILPRNVDKELLLLAA